MKLRHFLILSALAALLPLARAWVQSTTLATWPAGTTVTMQLRLGVSPALSDGRTWDANAIEAMQTWNGCMHDVQFAWQSAATTSSTSHNGLNDTAFADDEYGSAWDANTLAATMTWYSGTTRTESDILFNRAQTWDAYRGALRYPTGYGYPTSEFRRVAMHELGHVLGLGHPDEQGQFVSALMNSIMSDIETLTDDDKAGIGTLYGWGSNNQPTPPTILSQPVDAVAYVGDYFWFSVSANGSGLLKYQWRKEGVDIPNATNSSLAFNRVALTDAGNYTVVVSNGGGSVTSNTAKLNVLKVDPPQIIQQPKGATVTEGDYATMSAAASGHGVAMQWMKDGVAIMGATGQLFVFGSAKLADAATYTVVATTAGGSVTSDAAVLIVNRAPLPVITVQPSSVSVPRGEGAYFGVSVNAHGTASFQWYKNGVAIPGAIWGNYTIQAVARSDAGDYTVVVTDLGGSTTSSVAVLTVTDPTPPQITAAPRGGTITIGDYAFFSVSATGSDPKQYQWYKNGTAIAGAVDSSFSISSASPSDEGSYTVTVSNAGGTATSPPALVWLRARALNRYLTLWAPRVVVGDQLSLSISADWNSVLTYRWFKDGVVIPGATSAYWSIPHASAADAGEYLVEVTNSTGAVTSTPAYVAVGAPTATGGSSPDPRWVDLQSYNGIVYVLYSNPGRMERYDLANTRWLPSVAFGRSATAFRVDADGVFVSFGAALSGFDLQLGSETSLATLSSAPSALLTWKGFIYAAGASTFQILRKDTGTVLPTPWVQETASTLVVANQTPRLFGSQTSWQHLVSYPLQADGTVGTLMDSPYHYDFPGGNRLVISPDDARVVDVGGIVYRTEDLTFVGSLGGPVDDIVFINGGTVLLRGSRLLRYDDNLREQGFSTLPVIGDRVLVSGSNALVFSQATLAGGAIGVTRVSLASLGARTAAPVVDATGLAYSPDAVLVDKDATVLLLSRTNRNVFRWSTAEHRYLSPLRLSAAGSLVDYSQTLHRLVIAHSDGRICQLPLAAPTESYLAATPTTTVGLVAAGDVTLACDVSGAWATHFTFAADGRLASRVTWNYTSRVFTWSATNSEVLHFRDSMSPNDLHYEKILADATIGERGETPYHGEVDCTPPIRVSPDGTRVVLGSGQVFNRSDLRMATTLAIQFDDADWVGTTLTTIRARLRTSELQQWSGTDYSQIRSIEIDGYPLRMAALPNGQLLAVTLVQNQPRFYILDASLDIVFQSSTTPPPTISAQPSSTTVVRGSALNLSVTATGTGTLSYQWFFNGNPIAGATSSTLSLTNVDDSRAGTYSVRVSNGSSSVTSSAATVSVTASSSRLINLSARARVGTGADVLIPGFVVSGAAKRVLVRAAGPALLAMGVDTALADPVLELKTLAGVAVASNDDWNAADAATMAQAGAFAFAAGSKDAALVATLAPGLYTPIISGKNGSTGIGLVEVYDLDTNGGRLVNLSARARVGLGADVLIPGLVIQGDAPKRLLLRAAGPALLAMGVDTALADPVLELKTLAGASVASNDDWNAADAATMAQAGAFAFAAGSKDSALVVTLAPGLYTPVISGKNNTTGIALVEVYELP